MEDEIMELREEIDLLTKKVEILEAKDNRRRAFGYTKILIRIVLILVAAYGAWQGYEYATKEIPKIVEEKIKDINPIRKNF